MVVKIQEILLNQMHIYVLVVTRILSNVTIRLIFQDPERIKNLKLSNLLTKGMLNLIWLTLQQKNALCIEKDLLNKTVYNL